VDAWVIKIDAFGEMQWNKTHGGALDDSPVDMCETNDGGYALAGYTTSFGAGNMDFWLVKTDADGEALWSKTYGGTGDDKGYSLVATSDGGYALAGYTYSSGAGGSDAWLVKTDAAGNVQWNMTYGGTKADVGYFVVQTSDGGYAMTGYTASSGAGSWDVWLIKTDATGNMEWNMTYGGTGLDEGMHMIQTTEGGYAIICITTSFGAGSMDAWLIKTDAAGNMQWNQTYGGTKLDVGYGLIQTSDGGYAIAADTNSFGAGDKDFYIVKTDEFGVVPEYSSWLIPALVLTATAFILINKKRLLRKR
jgi:hypothetical protein